VSARAARPRPLRVFAAAFALFGLLTTLWSLATPIYSVPDENSHLAKVLAQWQGQYQGYAVDGVRHPVLDLPDGYEYDANAICFVYHPEIDGDCGVEIGAETGEPRFASWTSTYNPLYSWVVGWPSLELDGEAGVLAMRIVSGLASAALLAAAVAIAVASRRARWAPVGLAFLASPMVLYMSGAVNPQGLEIAAAAALWATLARLLESYRDPAAALLSRRALWIVGVLSAVVLANVRSLGPLWVAIVVVASLAIAGWPATRAMLADRRAWIGIGIVVAGGALSAGWTLTRGTLSGQALPDDAPLVGGSFAQGAWYMLRNTPKFAEQAIGYFGWFDAPLPGYLTGTYLAAGVVVLVIAATAADRRTAARIVALAALCLLVPVVVQGISVGSTGIIWQGRYGLFLGVALPILAGILLSQPAGARSWFLAPRITPIVAGMLAAYTIGAAVLVLRRYVVGAATPITAMLGDPQWQPPLTWPVLVAGFVLASAALALWLSLLARRIARAEDAETLADPSSSEPTAADPVRSGRQRVAEAPGERAPRERVG
jgi:hypothetical protein